MDSESDRKRKRDGEGSAAAQSAGVADAGAHAHAPSQSQLSLMAEMKAALDSNTSQMAKLQNKVDELEGACQSMQTRLDSSEEKRELLEAEFSSLKTSYRSMLRNNGWKYDVPDIPRRHWQELDYREQEIDEIECVLERMKQDTCSLWSGFCHDVWICLDTCGYTGIRSILEDDDALLSHWGEFAEALESSDHFDQIEGFTISGVHLSHAVLSRLTPAVKTKTFVSVELTNNNFEYTWQGVYFAIQLMENNPAMKSFKWGSNIISNADARKLMEAMKCLPQLENVTFDDSILDGDSRTGRALVDYFLTGCNNLRELGILFGRLDDDDAAAIADLLKQNTTLMALDLTGNLFTKVGCSAFASLLSHNRTLEVLDLSKNTRIKHPSNGTAAIRNSTYNEISLNTVADSNHRCEIRGLDLPSSDIIDSGLLVNQYSMTHSKKEKVYSILQERNAEGTNVSHLNQELGEEESLKLVPHVLKIPAQRKERHYISVPLSIMYELLRSWKMPSLYESHLKMRGDSAE